MVQRPDLRALLLGPGQIVEVQGVLGLHRAAQVAVAAVHAGALGAPLGVGPGLAARIAVGVVQAVVPVRIEADRLGHHAKAVPLAELVGGFVHQAGARGPLVIRQGLHIEHFAADPEMFAQGVEADRFRPAVLEHFRRRRHADIGVDQRAAADPRAQRHAHVAEIAEIQPAVLLLRLILVPQPVALTDAGVILRQPAPPALQHHHLVPFFRQPAGHHGTAEAAADNQRAYPFHGLSPVCPDGHQCFFMHHNSVTAPCPRGGGHRTVTPLSPARPDADLACRYRSRDNVHGRKPCTRIC